MNRHSKPLLPLSAALAVLLSGCAVEVAAPPPPRIRILAAPMVRAPEPAVVSLYVEPPLVQPEPIAVAWAPPPMLVEPPPPMPFADAVWTGGYWTWQGNWVWAAGRWAAPPQAGYAWVHPYYENRNDAVIFIGGHWAAPGVVFVPPPPTLSITVALAAPGVVPGPRPIGPAGVFVPAPPGSRAGLIVPAPIGTSPSVVVSAPPVTQVGMRVQANVNNTTNNNTRVTNITNVTNVTNVTVVAPASATASGRPFEANVPAQAHLAAALPPVVRARAPTPLSPQAVAAYEPGHAPQALPPAQAVRAAPPKVSEPAAPHREPAPAAEARAQPVPPRAEPAAPAVAEAAHARPEAQAAADHDKAEKAEKARQLAAAKKKKKLEEEEEAERRANGGR